MALLSQHRSCAVVWLSGMAVVLLLVLVGSTSTLALPTMTADYCTLNIAQEAQCPAAKPLCCSLNSIVRCCPYDKTCATCMTNAVGYEVTRGGIFITLIGLIFLTLFGGVITTGIGRNTAWLLEQQCIVMQLKKRAALRRAEAREFKQELNQTEETNLEENAACVVCCARRTDCALVPCGHVCCCHFCTRRLQECPVCRAVVEQCYTLPDYLVRRLLQLPPVSAQSTEGNSEEGGAAAGHTSANSRHDDEAEEMMQLQPHGDDHRHHVAGRETGGASSSSLAHNTCTLPRDAHKEHGEDMSHTEEGQEEASRELPVHNDTTTPSAADHTSSVRVDVLEYEEDEDEEDEHLTHHTSHLHTMRARHIPGMSALLRVAQRALRRRGHRGHGYVRVVDHSSSISTVNGDDGNDDGNSSEHEGNEATARDGLVGSAARHEELSSEQDAEEEEEMRERHMPSHDAAHTTSEPWHVLLTHFLIETDWASLQGRDALCDLVLMSSAREEESNTEGEKTDVPALQVLLAAPLHPCEAKTPISNTCPLGAEMPPQWHTAFFAFVLCATSYLHWSHPCNRGHTSKGMAEASSSFLAAFTTLYHDMDCPTHANNNKEEEEKEGESTRKAPVLQYMQCMPALVSLWRQPALLAALHALADAVWQQQAYYHTLNDTEAESEAHNNEGDQEEEEEEEEECEHYCVLCLACALQHTLAAEALWCLLLWHFSFACTLPAQQDAGSDADYKGNTTKGKALRMLWRHGGIACRSALYNGAEGVVRHILCSWLARPHDSSIPDANTERVQDDLLARVFAREMQTRTTSMSWSSFVLLQCNLLVRQFVFARHHADNSSSDVLSCEDDREEHVLCCLQCLYNACTECGQAACKVFAYLTCYTPYVHIGGTTLLTWLCTRRYMSAVRLVLYAAEQAHVQEHKSEGSRFAPAMLKSEQTPHDTQNDAVVAHRCNASDNAATAVATTATAYRVVFAGHTAKENNEAGAQGNLAPLTSSVSLLPLISPAAFTAAVRARDVSLTRLLLLAGASLDTLDEPTLATLVCDAEQSNDRAAREMLWLLGNPTEMLEASTNTMEGNKKAGAALAERVRHALCAANTAELLAQLSFRLWHEKVRILPQPTPYTPSSTEFVANNTAASRTARVLTREMMEKWGTYWAAQDRVLRPALASVAYDTHNVLARLTLLQLCAHKLRENMTLLCTYNKSSTTASDEAMTVGAGAGGSVWCEVLRYTATVARMYTQLCTTMESVERGLRLRAQLVHVQQQQEEEKMMMIMSEAEGKGDMPWKDAHRIVSTMQRLHEDKVTLLAQWHTMAEEHQSLLALHDRSGCAEDAIVCENNRSTRVRVALPHHTTQSVWVEVPARMDLERTLAQCGGAYGVIVQWEEVQDETSYVPWQRCEVAVGDLVAFQREAQTGKYVMTHHFSLSNKYNTKEKDGGEEASMPPMRSPRVMLSCVEKGIEGEDTAGVRVECTLCGVPSVAEMQPVCNPLTWLEVRPAATAPAATNTSAQQQQEGEKKDESTQPSYTSVLGNDIVATLMQRPQQWQVWRRIAQSNSRSNNTESAHSTLWLREVCNSAESEATGMTYIHSLYSDLDLLQQPLHTQYKLGRAEFAQATHGSPLEGTWLYVLQAQSCRQDRAMDRFVTTYLELLRQSMTASSAQNTSHVPTDTPSISEIDAPVYEAVSEVLPQWVELMSAAATTSEDKEKATAQQQQQQLQSRRDTRSSRKNHTKTSSLVSSYLNGDMAERYFTFAHHALSPAPWRTVTSDTAPVQSILPVLSPYKDSNTHSSHVLYRVLRGLAERSVVHHVLASCFLCRCCCCCNVECDESAEAVKVNDKTDPASSALHGTCTVEQLEQFVHDLLAELGTTSVTLDGLHDALVRVCTRCSHVTKQEDERERAVYDRAELRVLAELLYYASCEVACKTQAATTDLYEPQQQQQQPMLYDRTNKSADMACLPAFVQPALPAALVAALCRYFLLRVRQTLTRCSGAEAEAAQQQPAAVGDGNMKARTLRIGTLCAVALQHPMHLITSSSSAAAAAAKSRKRPRAAGGEAAFARTVRETATRSSRATARRGNREPAFTPLPLRRTHEPRWRKSIVIDVDATGSSLNTEKEAEQQAPHAEKEGMQSERRKRTEGEEEGEDKEVTAIEEDDDTEDEEEGEVEEDVMWRRHRLQPTSSVHTRRASALWPRQHRRSRSADEEEDEQQQQEDKDEEEKENEVDDEEEEDEDEVPGAKARGRSLLQLFQVSLANVVLTCYDVTHAQSRTTTSSTYVSSAQRESFPDLATAARRVQRLRVAGPERYAGGGVLHWYLLADSARHLAQLESASASSRVLPPTQ